MKFRFLPVFVLVLVLVILVGCSSTNSGSNPRTGYIYVVTQGDKKVHSYSVSLDNAALDEIGTAADTGTTPAAILLSSDGKSAYVLNTDDATISTYSIGSDGTLKAAGSPVATGVRPTAFALDSSGGFLFVANQGDPQSPGSDSISIYTVSGTTVTAAGNVTFPETRTPAGIAVVGNYVYVSNLTGQTFTSGSVSAYQFDTSAHTLSELGSSPYAVGVAPTGLLASLATTANPGRGNFLYVANTGSNSISAFAICALPSQTCVTPDGTLAPVAGSPFSAGLGPVSMAVALDGSYLFAVDRQSNQISQYKASTGTGVLTAGSPAAVSSGVNPTGMVVLQGSGTATDSQDYAFAVNVGAASVTRFSYVRNVGVLAAAGTALTTQGQPIAVAGKVQ
ncbi:MAG: beta-propeller fold lactonase family protein [Acidobacteria bacterium]|nr:beta-propeller fold lactonase family protein [Acidobacteriota bacterium]